MEGMENLPQQQRGEPSDQGRFGLLSSFKKMNPPMFNRDLNPQVAESWYQQIKRLLETMNLQFDQDRVALATILLEGKANHWWNMIRGTIQVEDVTWRQFKTLFHETYFPRPIKMQMACKFWSLTQGRMTMI